MIDKDFIYLAADFADVDILLVLKLMIAVVVVAVAIVDLQKQMIRKCRSYREKVKLLKTTSIVCLSARTISTFLFYLALIVNVEVTFDTLSQIELMYHLKTKD